jgi:hypothetical protein
MKVERVIVREKARVGSQIATLQLEYDKLTNALRAIRADSVSGRQTQTPAVPLLVITKTAKRRGRHAMSAAGRRAVGAASKRYWAKWRKEHKAA